MNCKQAGKRGRVFLGKGGGDLCPSPLSGTTQPFTHASAYMLSNSGLSISPIERTNISDSAQPTGEISATK